MPTHPPPTKTHYCRSSPASASSTTLRTAPAFAPTSKLFIARPTSNSTGAGPHVNSAHFDKAMTDLKPALVHTPAIVSRQVDGDGWGEMGELQID